MSDLRKAAEMAIETLLDPKSRADQVADAVEALRQALDKPEIEPQALVEMAVLAEREACAKVADQWNTAITDKLAAAIRERGEK